MILAVFFLNGFPRSGKDSFVRALNTVASEKNIRVAQASTVDRVKDALRVLGWNGSSKNEADRALMCDVKNAWTRHYDGSFKYVEGLLKDLDSLPEEIILTVDSREPQELARFKEAFGGPLRDERQSTGADWGFNARVILVDRGDRSEQFDNDADRNVLQFEYDFIVHNAESNDWFERLVDEARRVLCATI